MIGRRIYTQDPDDFWLEPGEYGKHPLSGDWYARPPAIENIGNLGGHSVIEHDDGTITVSPSILITVYKPSGERSVKWHGYLERGVWREC